MGLNAAPAMATWALLAALEPLRHDPGRLREAARDLLSRPPYTEAAPGPVTDVLARIRGWLARLLDAVFGAVAGSTAFAWGVVIVGTLVVVALALRWSRSVSADASEPGPTVGRRGRSAAEWRDEADGYARAQQWPEALRAAYGALVAELVEQGHLDDAGGLTVGEIGRQVSDTIPERAAAVHAAGRAFEDVWYGHRPADRTHYERVTAALLEDRRVRR